MTGSSESQAKMKINNRVRTHSVRIIDNLIINSSNGMAISEAGPLYCLVRQTPLVLALIFLRNIPYPIPVIDGKHNLQAWDLRHLLHQQLELKIASLM
jgi:hypothetical protein